MSLDGFIAGANDGPANPLGDGGGALFAWMSAGPERNRIDRWFCPPDASAPIIEEWNTEGGAIVSGRRTFDIANGWKDGHPIDCAASVTQQLLRAGLLDEINLGVVPVLLGAGTRLLDKVGPLDLEQVRVVESTGVTHLRYRVKH